MATLSNFPSFLSLSSRNLSFLDQLQTQNQQPKLRCFSHQQHHPRRRDCSVCASSIRKSRFFLPHCVRFICHFHRSFGIEGCLHWCILSVLLLWWNLCASGLVERRRAMRSYLATFASSLDPSDLRRIIYLLQRSFRSTEGVLCSLSLSLFFVP